MTEQAVIKCEVVKPFYEVRTPCPPAGTKGEIYDVDGEFFNVRFPLPMIDTRGDEWHGKDDGDEYMFLKFTADEIKEIED